MDYKLTHKLLRKYIEKDKDVVELVAKYTDAISSMRSWQRIAEDYTQQIKILNTENKYLKEDLDAI